MTSSRHRILLIEDEPHLAEGLMFNLRLQGHEILHCADGLEGLETFFRERPDLLILDLMLPRMDGISILNNLREKDETTPVLVLSAKNAQADINKGLLQGANDYMTKPFDLEELLLRVKKLLKASKVKLPSMTDHPPVPSPSSFSGNTIDFSSGETKTEKSTFFLTNLEMQVMKEFLENPKKLIERKKLLSKYFGQHEQSTSRTLDNFIVRLRKYFETKKKHFKSLRGKGYIFYPEGVEDDGKEKD